MLIAAIASSVVVGVLYTGFVVRMLWLERRRPCTGQ
jgi:hypothetical protein